MGSSLTVHREVIDDRNAGDCIALADIDGDGSPDIINGGGLTDQAVGLRLYRSSSAYGGETLLDPPAGTALVGACIAGDADGDGDPDLFTVQAPIAHGLATGPAELIWWENPGVGSSAAWPAHRIGAHPSGVPLDLAVADLNGDGALDVASRSETALAVWTAPAPGTPSGGTGPTTTSTSTASTTSTATTSTPAAAPWSETVISVRGGRGLVAADVDRDGDEDLLAGGQLLRKEGSAWRLELVADTASATAAVLDANGDTELDIVLGPFDADGPIVLHHRDPNGEWRGVTMISAAGGPVHGLQVTDVDHDADPDVIVAMVQRPLTALLNLGQGLRWEPTVLDADGLFSVALGDVDLDHDTDLVGSGGAGHPPLVLFRSSASEPAPIGTTDGPVAVTGGPTPTPSTTAPPTSTTPPADNGTGDDTDATTGGNRPNDASGVGGGDSSTTTGTLPASGEVALGDPTMATVPTTQPTTSTTADLATTTTIDGEVSVLPQSLERTNVLAVDRIIAVLLAAFAAAVGWVMCSGRALVPSLVATGRRGGSPDHTVAGPAAASPVSGDAGATGAPDAETDPAAPTGSGPAS